MNTLMLFDIDGTLSATTLSDGRCFATSFEHVFGFPCPTTDWHAYQHVTDSGIVHELLEGRQGRRATASEWDAFVSAYMEILANDHAVHPHEYGEIPGAASLIRELVSPPNAQPVALATGCMKRSAMFKLSKAGIDGSTLAGGFADDAISRVGIARCAIARAGGTPSDIVYIGDGIWDVLTSAQLGMRFVGIAHQSDEQRLRDHGATSVIADLNDRDTFFRAVDEATVPRWMCK